MSVNSKARILKDKSSVSEILRILKHLKYEFQYFPSTSGLIEGETFNECGHIVGQEFINIWIYHSNLEKYLTLSSVSDEKHFNLLKEILEYVGGSVTLNDCSKLQWVHVTKLYDLENKLENDEEDRIHTLLREKFTFNEIEKIIENKEIIKKIFDI
jgi:hypothetical protein